MRLLISLLFMALGAQASNEEFRKKVCSEYARTQDCIEYGKRMRNMIFCRWEYMFSNLLDLDLEEQNYIYAYAKPYCDAWKLDEREPSELFPDIYGNYCSQENKAAWSHEDNILCANYKLAKLYWKREAINMFFDTKHKFSLRAMAIFYLYIEDIDNKTAALISDLQSSDRIFPLRRPKTNWLTNIIISNAALLIGFWYLRS